MLLQEVSGALYPESHDFLRAMAELHDNKLAPALAGSWTAVNFETYFLQRLSSAVNMAAAHEIQNAISRGNRLPTAACEAWGQALPLACARRALSPLHAP